MKGILSSYIISGGLIGSLLGQPAAPFQPPIQSPVQQKDRRGPPQIDPRRPLSQPQTNTPKQQPSRIHKPEVFEIGIARNEAEMKRGQFYSQLAKLAEDGKIIFGPKSFRSVGYWDKGKLVLAPGCEFVDKETIRCGYGDGYALTIKISDLPTIVVPDENDQPKFITRANLQDFINEQERKVSFSAYNPLNKKTPPVAIMQIISKSIERHDAVSREKIYNNVLARDRTSVNIDENTTNIPVRVTQNDRFIMPGFPCNVLFGNNPSLYPSFRDMAGSGSFGTSLQGAVQNLPPSVLSIYPGVSVPAMVDSGSITIGATFSFALPWKTMPCAVILLNNQTRPDQLIAVLTIDREKKPEGYYAVGGRFKITFYPEAFNGEDAVQFYIDGKRVSPLEFKKAAQSYPQR